MKKLFIMFVLGISVLVTGCMGDDFNDPPIAPKPSTPSVADCNDVLNVGANIIPYDIYSKENPAGTLKEIKIAPKYESTSVLHQKTIVGYQAVGCFIDQADKEPVDITDNVMWDSSNKDVALFSESNLGILLIKDAGATFLTATKDGVIKNYKINVKKAKLLSLSLIPNDTTVTYPNTSSPVFYVGAYVQFRVMGAYDDLTNQDLNYSVSWTSSNKENLTFDPLHSGKAHLLKKGTSIISICPLPFLNLDCNSIGFNQTVGIYNKSVK